MMGTSQPRDSVSSALFGDTRRAVLALLFSSPDRAFYVREIIRASGIGQGSVQRELERLAGVGLIKRSEQGRQVYYQADRDAPVFEELRGLVLKTAGLAEVLRDALVPAGDAIEVAFVYGSLASGEETTASDVDLMVIGGVDEMVLHKTLAEAEHRLRRTVNYTLIDQDELRDRAREGGFVTRVLSGPKIMIIGEEHELRRAAEG